MVFSQSQFYDVVQYAESMGLDPKIFSHEIIDARQLNFLGIKRKIKIKNPYYMFKIKNQDYYFTFTYSIGGLLTNANSSSTTFYWLGEENDKKSLYNLSAKVRMSPAVNMLKTSYYARGLSKKIEWKYIFEWAKTWINNLVDEIHAIESLERINSVPLFFTDSRTYNDFGTSFNPQQASVLRDKIYLLKSSIVEKIPLNETQFSIINEKLDELAKKVDKVSKFDFRTLFFGILTNLASSVLYDDASVFWKLVRKIFGGAVLGDGNTDLLS